MNQKRIFNLFNSKGTGQAAVQRQMSSLAISLVALPLLALTACVQAPASEPVAVAPPQAEAVAPAAEALPNIDPADRKFFSPGYGAQTVMSSGAEVFPNIDPADRKFFSPGYGAQTVISREAEALPNIDPADRKFFSPGYGAQTVVSNELGATIPTIENKVGKQSAVWLLLK